MLLACLSAFLTFVAWTTDALPEGAVHLCGDLTLALVGATAAFMTIESRDRALADSRKHCEAQLRRQSALASLGEMASMVAHQIRTPLAGVSGALQVLERRLGRDDDNRAVIGEVLQRLATLDDTIGDMLAYARPRPVYLKETDLLQLVAEAAHLVHDGPDLQGVEVHIEGESVVARIDRAYVVGVFVNLIVNAAHAMERRGSVRVRVSAKGPFACIEVIDEGPGIPPDVLESIFVPFFTTKDYGTGLGLPFAQRVVELHGGAIEALCPPGGGTRMVVRLPRDPTASPQPDAAPDSGPSFARSA